MMLAIAMSSLATEVYVKRLFEKAVDSLEQSEEWLIAHCLYKSSRHLCFGDLLDTFAARSFRLAASRDEAAWVKI